MQRVQTLVYDNGDFQTFDGNPEEHGLTSSSSYTFERDGEHWTVYLADDAPQRTASPSRRPLSTAAQKPKPRPHRHVTPYPAQTSM